jgi:NDP-sugar pyrophosphorylase family protein
MSKNFSLDAFFSISKFSYQELWEKQGVIWLPLLNLDSFCEDFSYKNKIKIPSSVFLENPSKISIGEGTVIEPGAFIRGPCIIGKNCTLRHGSYLRGNVVIGDNCVIGHGTEVKHSVLLDYVHAAHFSYIGNSILGNNVNLGAGVKCANFRLDRKSVCISYMGKKINTGLRKFGAIIGDFCQIGCNTVINPGSLLHKSVSCYPSLTLSGIIAAGSLIKANCDTSLIKKKMEA